MVGTWGFTEATNIVVVTGGTSGTPATFADFVTADRAGTATLKAATNCAKDMTLTYPIRPCELRALQISFVIASKTAETDYLWITGTDAWGTALYECIDISAGNGTYVSTQYFATITDIDIEDVGDGSGTAAFDGTLQVTQPQWGIIWDYGNGQYLISAYFGVGDGTTPTYFADNGKQIDFDGTVLNDNGRRINILSSATFMGGELIDATDKATKNGINFFDYSVAPTSAHRLISVEGTGSLLLYSCSFYNLTGVAILRVSSSGTNRIWNCLCSDNVYIWPDAATNVYNVTLSSVTYAINLPHPDCVFNRILGLSVNTLVYSTGPFEVSNFVSRRHVYVLTTGSTFLIPEIGYFTDCEFDSWNTNINSGSTGWAFRRYTCNITVKNNAGTLLDGVEVLCEDQVDATAWTTTTGDTDTGKIDEQLINYQRFYYSGGQAVDTYSPHKFTFSKAGYKTLIKENITVDHPIVWDIELQYVAGARNQTVGMGVRMS